MAKSKMAAKILEILKIEILKPPNGMDLIRYCSYSHTIFSSISSKNTLKKINSKPFYGFENTVATKLDLNPILGCRAARC